MAYIKNTWVDQEVERPRTYQKEDHADGSFTLIDDFGLVSELGTPVNADNMNHIEEGIGEHEERITILEEQAKLTSKANISLNNLDDVGADKLNTSKMYTTGKVSEDTQGFAQLQQMRRSTFDLSKFTVVGSPTITDDGVASGFSGSNYLTTNLSFSGNEIEITMPINTTNITTNQYLLNANNKIRLDLVYISSAAKIFPRMFLNDGTNTWYVRLNAIGLEANKNYTAKFKYNISTNTTNVSLYGENGALLDTTSDHPTNTINLSFSNVLTKIGESYLGSIDLKQFSITVDGKEVFSGNKTGIDVINNIEIPYTLSKTGSKIVDVAYRDRVIDLYEQEGQAGYYTIDEENKNFTLPMGEIYGMIENKADKATVEESLAGKVSKSGDTMTGNLKFQQDKHIFLVFDRTDIEIGTTGSERRNVSAYTSLANGNTLGLIQNFIDTDGSTGLQMITRKPDNSAYGAYLELKTTPNGSNLFDFPKCTTKATTTSTARSNLVAVVVQNYVNGTSWYRVWSDGWIEQGGSLTITEHTTATVTLLKPFSNTNYTLLYTQGGWNDGYTRSDTGITAITTTNFKIGSTSGCSTLGRWYACGY